MDTKTEPDPPTKHDKIIFIRRSLALTETQWRNLERLASVLDTKAKAGSRRGQPSWRTMIAQLADEAPETIKGIQIHEDMKSKVKSDLKEHTENRKTEIVRAGDIPA